MLDRVIVDKNARIGEGARLVNERGIQDVDGDGYYIRSGIIIVPKNGVVKPGTVVVSRRSECSSHATAQHLRRREPDELARAGGRPVGDVDAADAALLERQRRRARR